MKLDSVNDVLDFAIANEESAAKLYQDLAKRVERPGMRETFLEFAQEELRHKAKLLQVKSSPQPAISGEKVVAGGLADYLVEAEPSPAMTYPEALLFAMKAEKAAFKLYDDLAASAQDPMLVQLFRSLAQEEARHKLRFELEYEENVLEGV